MSDIPSHLLSWSNLHELKNEKAHLSHKWQITKIYDRLRVIEILITQITSYLVKNNIA